MRKFTSERGMSLIEATIILMVLAILTSVLAPSVGDYVNDARQTKVKEDVEALGTGILRMLRDTGKPFPQRVVGTGATSYDDENRVDLLVSEGNAPTSTAMGPVADAAAYFVNSTFDIDDSITALGPLQSATAHLVTNAVTSGGYTAVTFPAQGGPRPGLGWRGGYISSNTGPDPWGNRYHCATVWLNPSADSVTKGTGKDAFCASAGGDGIVSTDIDGNSDGGVAVSGDDSIYVFQGNTR